MPDKCALCPLDAEGIARIGIGKECVHGEMMVLIVNTPLCEACYENLKQHENKPELIRDLVEV